MRCSDLSQIQDVFRSENVAGHQEATLRLADVVTFQVAYAALWVWESATSNTAHIEVLVHSKRQLEVTSHAGSMA